MTTNSRQVIFGGADGIRTHDLLDAIEARSQLRHGPTGGTTKAYHSPPRGVLPGQRAGRFICDSRFYPTRSICSSCHSAKHGQIAAVAAIFPWEVLEEFPRSPGPPASG